MTREEVIQFLLDTGVTPKNIMKFVEALSNHTDAEIQKMQDLEQAEIEKSYEIGKSEGSRSVYQQGYSDAMRDFRKEPIRNMKDRGKIKGKSAKKGPNRYKD